MTVCTQVHAKQGYGYDVIVDNQSLALDLEIRIQDPADLENDPEFIDVTHSQSENNKEEQPDELGNPLTRQLVTFYNAGNQDLLNFMTAASRKKLRSIIDVHPIHPGEGNHNAFVKACGYVVMTSISNTLTAGQTTGLTLKLNEADDPVAQQDVVAPTVTDITKTDIELSSANISDGTIIAEMDGPLYATNTSFFLLYLVSGTGDDDNLSVRLEGAANGKINVVATGPIAAGAFTFLIGIVDYPARRVLGRVPVIADTQVQASEAQTMTIVA